MAAVALNHVGIPILTDAGCKKISFGRTNAERVASRIAAQQNCKVNVYFCRRHRGWHVGHNRLGEPQ